MTTDTHKVVVVLNEKMTPGRALNVASHLSLGIVAAVQATSGTLQSCAFTDYPDADGGSHAPISALPLIVLAGKASWLNRLRDDLYGAEVEFCDFTNLMTEGSYRDQQAAMAASPATDLVYLGVAAIGPREALDPLTRRFSLWR